MREEVRALGFFFFKIFKRLEGLFLRKLIGFLSVTGLGRIPGVIILYGAWRSLCDSMYDRLKPKGVILIDIQGNKMYVNTNDRGIVPWLLIDGVMEEYETKLFRKIVKEGMVVVDIGANIGYYSLIAAKLVGKSGIVYAFEPEPSNYELLCKNIEVNSYTNVVPIQKAVSNKQGRVKLWVNKADLAAPSFSEDNASLFSKYSAVGETSFVEVETTTLDEFFKSTVRNIKVDIIKIDTQGAEGLVVDGAQKILQSNHLKIITEFWPDGLRNVGNDPLELLSKLQEYGFKIEFINERKQTLEPIEEVIRSCEKARLTDGFNLLLQK